jgi:hypothetical protein
MNGDMLISFRVDFSDRILPQSRKERSTTWGRLLAVGHEDMEKCVPLQYLICGAIFLS